MTAKTHGYITKEIELEQIYQFVLKYFDPEAKVNRYENRFGESNEMAVYFTYKGEERRPDMNAAKKWHSAMSNASMRRLKHWASDSPDCKKIQ